MATLATGGEDAGRILPASEYAYALYRDGLALLGSPPPRRIVGHKAWLPMRGASGEIGHIQFEGSSASLCRCGKFGCAEARAAGWVIARDLRANRYNAHNARDMIDLLEQREPDCIQRVREAGRVTPVTGVPGEIRI
jgi:hypothetical protein